MGSVNVTFADDLSKQLIDNWGKKRGFDAADQIAVNLEDRFSVESIHIIEAKDQSSFLVFSVTTNRWSDPREFALLGTGSLVW